MLFRSNVQRPAEQQWVPEHKRPVPEPMPHHGRLSAAEGSYRMVFKYFFKMWIAVWFVSNAFTITMAIFDVGQNVVNRAAGVINQQTAINIDSVITSMETAMESMEIGELIILALETLLASLCLKVISVFITVILYGRMIEIYRASRSAAFHPKAVRGHFGNPALASR